MRITDDTSREDLIEYIKVLEYNASRLLVDAYRDSLKRKYQGRYVDFTLLSPHTIPWTNFTFAESRTVDVLTVDLHEHLME